VQLGRTPLWAASLNGNTAVAEVLLAHGADVNTCDKVTSLFSLSSIHLSVPIRLAISQQRDHVRRCGGVGLRWMKREDVRGWVQRSRTSLWIAVEKGHTRVVDLLVAHDAEIDTPNEVRSCPNTFRTA